MKKFKFRLQNVHDLRLSRREEAERDLARALAEREHAAAELDRMNARRERMTDDLAAALRIDAPCARDAQIAHDYLNTLARDEQERRDALARCDAEVARRRELLAEAARAREATASLRERHHAQHRQEVMRSEQNQLDEIASLGAARRRLAN